MMKMSIDHNSPLPLHIQVENILRQLIQQEEYRQGKLLPNEVETSKLLGISRNTFRAAMDKLVYEGLVTRQKGIGSKVNTHVMHTTLSEWSSFTHEMNNQGIEFMMLDKKISWVYPDAEVAAALEITPAEKIVRLERLKGDHDSPVVWFDSYFHPRIGIGTDETFDGPLYEILEQKYHVIPMISKEEIGVFPPEKRLKNKLAISANTPILYRKRIVCNAAERPLEFCCVYYRSDRFVYNIKITRGST